MVASKKLERTSKSLHKSRKQMPVAAPVQVPDVAEVVAAPVVEHKIETIPETSEFPSTLPSEFLSKKVSALSREEMKAQLYLFLSHLAELKQDLQELLQASKVKKTQSSQFNKNWKVLMKEFKLLKTVILKSVKPSKKTVSGKTHSGFSTPVQISQELADFAGWSSLVSTRRDVTKFVCDYIKAHELQNPSDKRIIIADEKLAKLLQYNPEVEPKLTYAYLQTKLRPHFSKIAPETSA